MSQLEKALAPVEQKEVLFYDDRITAVILEEEGRQRVYVPLRPLCEHLGVTWSPQRRRVNRDPVLSKKMKGVTVTVTPGGAQEMLCLPLEFLNGWLFGINADRVKAEIRERVIRYQEECYLVLAEAFGAARPVPSPANPLAQVAEMGRAITRMAEEQMEFDRRLGDTELTVVDLTERVASLENRMGDDAVVTEAQASQISQAVKAVAMALSQKTKRNEYGGVYGELYRRFEITSYKLLPAGKFDEAMNFLTEWHQSIVDDQTPF